MVNEVRKKGNVMHIRFQSPYYQCIIPILFINFLISRSNETSMRAMKKEHKENRQKLKDLETRMLGIRSELGSTTKAIKEAQHHTSLNLITQKSPL